MKYIRTKDGIYEVEEWFKPLENDMVYIPNEGLNKILNKADTIEELCDEFVFIDEFFKREHRLAYSLENALARCKYHDADITTLRGAIWTDKGLIYVAKMNDKGDLELL